MSFYSDSIFPVRQDLADLHQEQLAQLAEPGAWGKGAQRVAVAQETRNAGYAAGIYEKPDNENVDASVELPAATRKFIHHLALSPKDFQEDSYDEARASGLSDEQYVEMVGIISRVCDMDVFARGIGVPLRPLPTPKEGKPSRERPEMAIKEHAWVATVPNPPAGGEFAKELYRGHPMPYIVRALSLVPDELRRHVALEEVHYLPLAKITDPKYEHHEGFTRPQVEVVAGRVSAINECFF